MTNFWKNVDLLRNEVSADDCLQIILSLLSLKSIKPNFKITSPELLNEEFIALENEMSVLKDVFYKDWNKIDFEKIKLINESLIDFRDESMGNIYESFLKNFFTGKGTVGGEFYTPISVINLIIQILKPHGSVYDPTSGIGGMLVEAKKYDLTNVAYGQEFNNITWKLAKLNFFVHNYGLIGENEHYLLGQKSDDTLLNDLHSNYTFDFILANPPFNVKSWNQDQLLKDKRWQWGVPPKGNANYAWLSHVVSKLSINGRAAVVLANGSLSSSQKAELEIRKNLIKTNKLEAIIELPDKLFYSTSIPACIWFFNNQKTTNDVLMVSANAFETNMVTKKLRELTNDDIEGVALIFEMFLEGKKINELGNAKSVTIEELEQNDYSVVPGRYVGAEEEQIDKEAVKIEIQQLAGEITQLLNEFATLQPQVLEAIEKALAFEDEEN